MLSQTLKALERDGLVTRRAFPTVPVTVEYSITPLGATLSATVDEFGSVGRAITSARSSRRSGDMLYRRRSRSWRRVGPQMSILSAFARCSWRDGGVDWSGLKRVP